MGFSALLSSACGGQKPAQAPSAPTESIDATDAELTSSLPTKHEDLETCRERILNEGIPSTGSGAVDGSDLARAAEDARKKKDGQAERAAYFDLISKAPGSPYVPFAYFEFAELFKAEAASDPTKLPLAEEALKQAVQAPAPKNRLYLLASYRLAQTYVLEKQTSQARDAYQHAIDDATTHGEWDCALPVAEAARDAYEQLEKPEDE
ncbi:MAG TPA: hypothetical protein VMI54_12890 [Polyangiaceae bacterium]|nr:hypothetical protein [Polyangiaceae bacterium]